MRLVRAIGLALLVAIAACSGESELGEACDSPGGTDGVCDDGTVCGWPSDKSRALVCIPACLDGSHCPKDYECKESVEHSPIKGCRLKD